MEKKNVKKVSKKTKENSKKKKEYSLSNKFLIFAIAVVLLTLVSLIYYNFNKELVRTKDIKIWYRTYTKEKGWTKWSKNGNESGTEKYPIRAIEIKVKGRNTGDVFYNTYSNNKWMDNDAYSGKTAGDKKHKIEKVRMMLSDTLYRRYNIKYRVFTNKKMTKYVSNYFELSGGKEIYKIQIKVEERE